MEKKTIGSFIAILRKEAGLTQRELDGEIEYRCTVCDDSWRTPFKYD